MIEEHGLSFSRFLFLLVNRPKLGILKRNNISFLFFSE